MLPLIRGEVRQKELRREGRGEREEERGKRREGRGEEERREGKGEGMGVGRP